MRTIRFHASAVAGGAILSLALTAHAQSRRLTVEDAEQLAIETSPLLQAGAADVRSSRELTKSARGQLLPSLHVSDEFQRWNAPYVDDLGSNPVTMTPQLFSIRDQNINTFTASVDEPLVGLAHLSHEVSAQARSADAHEAQLETTRADLRAAVETYYLQMFEARALEQIAKASEEELAEQVTIADARLKAGVLTKADVLRVRVSQANAKEQEIQAHAQGEVARANLLGRVGLPIEERTVEFVEPEQLLAQAHATLPDVAGAEKAAIAQRPEMKQRDFETESARQTSKARSYLMLPDVNFEGGYVRTDGSVFNPPNAAYVGLKAQWAIWEWGATYYAQKAASAQAEAAHFQAEEQKRRINIEIASDLAQATSAAAAVDVAQQTIESAEEAYRVTKAALAAGTATTTDLLDAQAALTQARLNLTRAQYEDALTRVTLKRGLGAK